MKKYLLILLIAICVVSCGDKDKNISTYTVKFESNGGSAVEPLTRVVSGSIINAPEDPVWANHTFVGWFTDDETFVRPWDFATKVVTADMVLYARWLEGVWTKVRTATDLDAVREDLAGNYLLMNDISLADYSSGEGWRPIGDSWHTAFTGKFDGNDYTITNLTINRPEEDFVGLFGFIDGGSVANLGVEIGAGGVNGGIYVGGVAGYIENSIITNCYSTGSISSYSYFPFVASSYSYSGGITGYVYSSTITKCYSIGDISSSSSFAYSGGIAGIVSDNSTITNCYSTGNISSVLRSYSGGIAGNLRNSIITNCYSIGRISSDFSYAGSSGGIAGTVNTGTITNCVAINSLINGRYAGGIVSLIYGPLMTSNNFAVDEIVLMGDETQGDNGTPKTLTEFRTRDTYETGLGWDFATVWKMPASGGGFPIFRWQVGQ